MLLTGASGQVGHELKRELAPFARAVVAPTRGELDLSSPTAIRDFVRSVRPTLIVNASAHNAVDRAEDEEREPCRAVNAVAPGILAEEAARLGAAIVHYSTDYVFDGEKGAPYVESDEPRPLMYYGRTKLEGERAVAAAGCPYLVLRTSWVYGRRTGTFMRTVLEQARTTGEIRVVADQFSIPTWARGVAAGTVAALAALAETSGDVVSGVASVSGVYHFAARGSASRYEWAEAILALDPAREEHRYRRLVPIRASEFPSAVKRPVNTVLDSTLARERLGVSLPDWRDLLGTALSADRGEAHSLGAVGGDRRGRAPYES